MPPTKNIGTPNRPMPKGRAIDPIRVLRRYWKGIPIWGTVGAIIGASAFFLFARIYPLYSGDVMFEIRAGLAESTDIGTSDTISEKMIERVAATQVYLIRERSILLTAVNNRAMTETEWIKQFIDQDTKVLLVDDAVDELLKEISTPVKKGTNLFGVSWAGHKPSDVPIILGSISQSYLQRTKELDDEGYRNNAKLFEDEGRHIKFMLQDLLDDLQAFIQAKGITTLDDTRFSTAMYETQKLTENLTAARQGLTTLNHQYLQVAAKLDGTMRATMEDRLEAERDPIIIRQEQMLESLEASLRALRERLNSSHPQIKDAEISVQATKDQVESKIEIITRRNLNAQLRELASTKEQLVVSLERTEQDIEIKDAALRDLAANQSVYEHMESSRKQLESQRDENQRLISSLRLMQLRADASRIRQATLPVEPREKSFPKVEVMIPVGIFLGVACFVGIIFLRELTDQKIRSASDVFIIPGAKVTGVLPDIIEDPSGIEDPELAVLHYSETVFAESCRQAWAGVSRSMSQLSHQTLLILSAAPEAGATTIIGNFAAAAVAAGQSVVVLDCNFRRPNVGNMFDFDDASLGVADALAGSVEIASTILTTESGIDVICAGTPANRLFQRLGSEKMKSLMQELRAKYDLVLIDAPPSIVAGDAVLLANLVDAITLVVHSDRDERGLVARVLRELGESRADILGVTLNAAVGTVGGYFRKNYLAMISYSEQGEDEE